MSLANPAKSKLRRHYYFVPTLLGLLICFLSIAYPMLQGPLQQIVLTFGVAGGVLRVIWTDRAKPKFTISMTLAGTIHFIVLFALKDQFPLRSIWYVGILALIEVGLLSLLTYKIMGLYQDD